MGKRVLIAKFLQFDESISEMLGKNGYDVVGVTDTAEQCIKLYEELKPDLVLTNPLLADGIGGYLLADALLVRDPEARVVILAKSGGATAGMVETATRFGAADFIILPVDGEKLIARIGKCLAEPAPARPRQLRVALVRGRKAIQPELREMLEACPCRVVLDVDSGEAVLNRYGLIRPDMVITDLELGREMDDGPGLLSALRARDPAVRVMVLTNQGSDDGEILKDVMARGACGFIDLPVTVEGLIKALSAAWTCKLAPNPDAGMRAIVVGGLFNRKYVKDILRRNNFEVLAEVGSDKQCVELCRELKPDLILVNADLTGKLGVIHVVHFIRMFDPYARVVLYEGGKKEGKPVDKRLRWAAFKRGVCDYVSLPFEEEKLEKRLGGYTHVWVPGK